MALAQGTGPVPAAKQDGDKAIPGAKGGQSRNWMEVVRHISSEHLMLRTAAFGELLGITKALAYLAATAEYPDIKEAAIKRLMKDPDGVFRILEGLTGRCPEPWERKLVRILKERLDSSGGAKLLGLKLWQLEDSQAFRMSGSVTGGDGKKVEFIEETPTTPPSFNENFFAGIIEETQA